MFILILILYDNIFSGYGYVSRDYKEVYSTKEPVFISFYVPVLYTCARFDVHAIVFPHPFVAYLHSHY